ncbi:LamG domain-containing protein [Candidatus Poribacteria bacterium]|nr:LamG domain-containing protein [Candidatus Poribacteria bacterium]
MRTTIVRFTRLCASVVFMSLVLTCISDAKLELKDVVAIWLLDEGTGNKVTDASGNGHDGAFASGKPKWVDGKFGKALSFNGQNDWVAMNDPVIPETVDLTIGCWVNPGDTQKTWTNILSSHNAGPPPRGISFEQRENRINLMTVPMGTGGGKWNVDDVNPVPLLTQLKTNEWNHFVVVKKGDQSIHYLNGQVSIEGKVLKNPIGAPTAFLIGSGHCCGGREFNGIVDEAFFFAGALSQDEVQTIMEKGFEGAQSVSPADKVATSWGKIKTGY